MFATEFIFDGVSSYDFELILCSFDGNRNGSFSPGSKIEFTKFKSPNSYNWMKISSTYNEPLTFTFQLCKHPCHSNRRPFSEREAAFIVRWLVRKEFKYLQFVQRGYEDVYFNVQLNVEKYMVGGYCYGFIVNATCDAPFAWSEPKRLKITTSNPIVDLYDDSDELGELKPTMEIDVKKAGTISIENSLTNKKMVINNCLLNEHIIIDDMKITSSECAPNDTGYGYTGKHKTFFDDFNWEWFTIGNTMRNTLNKITASNCDVVMNWRVPRKAGV